MTDTADDIKPVALGGRTDYVALAKLAGKAIGILGAAIIGLIPVYRSVTADGEARAQAAKNKAEAGYQVTRQAMEALEHRVLTLEQAAHAVQVAPPPRKGARRTPPALPVAVIAHPRVLPADLDKAERQVYRGVPQSPAQGPDAKAEK